MIANKVDIDLSQQNFDTSLSQGIYTDLSSERYHGDTKSISRSAIMDFKKSPRRYWSKYINLLRPAKESTAAMRFGSAFHSYILEPDLFHQQYYVKPEKLLLKDVGRETYDDNNKLIKELENCGKTELSSKDFEVLLAMRYSVENNSKAWALIQSGIYESSYFWQDKVSGLIVKSRPDVLHSTMYIDLKTVSDASPHTYQKEMALYGYHIQAAMVMDGVLKLQEKELEACINVCVEKTYPYSVGIYIIDESAIQAGREEYKRLLLDMKTCIVNNDFPDFEPQTIGLPRWYQ